MCSEQPDSPLAAAHQIAHELRVDPNHRGTRRLAAALGEPPVDPEDAGAGERMREPRADAPEARSVIATITPSSGEDPPVVQLPVNGRVASRRG